MILSFSLFLSLLFVVAVTAEQQQSPERCSLCPIGTSIVAGREQRLVQPRKSQETCSTMSLKLSLSTTVESNDCQTAQLLYQEKCCFQAVNEEEEVLTSTSSTEEDRELQYTVPISGTTPYGSVQSYNGGGGSTGSAGYQASASAMARGPYSSCNLCMSGAFPSKPFNIGAAVGYGTHKCGDWYHMLRNGQMEDRMCRPMEDFMQVDCGC